MVAAPRLNGEALSAWLVYCKTQYGLSGMAEATWDDLETCLRK